ncbi:MAG: hypothetical protein AB1489_11150 [Acidobacteriota bacterium]
MNEVDEQIRSVTLPLALPEEAFLLFGKERRVPDFALILSCLPASLRACLDPNATASGGGQGTYLLPLMDGRFLKMKIAQRCLVELSAVEE